MADTRVGIDLVATNRASPVINQVKKSLGGLEEAAGVLSQGLGGLAGAAGVGALVGLVQQIGTAAAQMMELADKTRIVGTSMQGLAASFGQTADGMLSAMKRASMGTISEYDLMLAANKAMMLGVAQNAGELEGILKVAMSRGAAMGLSTTQAFDDLVTGLGRGSALILDNLGITMDSLKSAEESYAASLGKTVSQLTDQEKKQGMVNAVLKESASLDPAGLDNMAGGMARLRAAVSDLNAAIAEDFQPAMDTLASGTATMAASAAELLDYTSIWELAFAAISDASQSGGLLGGPAFQMPRQSVLTDILNRPENAASAAAVTDTMNNNVSADGLSTAIGDVVTRLEEWRQAATDASVAQIKGVDEAGVAFEVFRSRLEGLTPALANAFDVGTAMSMVSGAADAMEKTIAAYEQMNWSSQRIAAVVSASSDQIVADFEAMLEPASKMDSLAGKAAMAGSGIEQVAMKANAAGREMLTAAEMADRLSWALGSVAGAAQKAQASLIFDQGAAALKSAAMGAIDAMGSAAAYGLYQDQLESLADAQAYYISQGYQGVELEFAMQQEVNERTEATRLMTDGINAAKDAMNNGTTAATKYGDALGGIKAPDIGSKVSGALQSALNLDVGVNPADYMPRPDAANENARRLADIMVNGMQGQSWMGEFATEVPDIYSQLLESQDPSAAAAQLLSDFQKGLVPQLIDKETIMQQVKDALIGDANMQALAQEITQDLVSQGAGDPAQIQALVNQSMGMKAGTTTTGDLTTNVIGQLQSENFLSGVKGAGGTAATNWGTAFLAAVGENVPTALILILAQLVAPILAGQQADDASRTGAQ
jgi:hypothetical protein